MAQVPVLADLGQRIRKLRVERRLTLKQLEDSCRLSATHLSEIERGRTSPTVGALIRIARSLKKDPAFFLETEERADAAHSISGGSRVVSLSEGVTAETLTDGIPGSSLFVYRLRFKPAAQISLRGHETAGEAIYHLVRGKAEMHAGETPISLSGGDTVHASTRFHHRIRSVSGEPVEMIAILTRQLDGAC